MKTNKTVGFEDDNKENDKKEEKVIQFSEEEKKVLIENLGREFVVEKKKKTAKELIDDQIEGFDDMIKFMDFSFERAF